MQRIGKQAFVFFSVLLLALGLPLLGLVPAVTAPAFAAGPGNGTGELDVAPAIHPAINFTAFPNSGGPYIMHATARPSGLRYAGGGATANSDVLLVFNEPIDGATLDLNGSASNGDFIAYGFTFQSAQIDPNYPNVVRLNQTTGAAAGDQIRLAFIGAIAGNDGSESKDLTTITIGSGPVICSVDFDDQGDTVVANDVITVSFDADVDFGSGDNEDSAFGSTAEFDGADLDNPAANADEPFFNLNFDYDNGEPYPNVILPGVTHLILAQNRVRWEDVNTENNTEQRVPVTNDGPGLVAAYWDSFNTALWVVMNDPVDPTSTTGGWLTDYFDANADGGNWDPNGGAGDVQIAFPGEITPVLKVTNIDPGAGDAEPTENDEITNSTCGALLGGCVSLRDYQGLEALNNYTTAIHVGPGIIRASYDDRQTASRVDDFLYVWLSETSADLTDIGVADFVSVGFDISLLSVNDRRNENGLTRITFTGFTNTNYVRPGSRIGGDSANDIVGENSLDDMDSDHLIRIWDESRPYSLTMTENAEFTYDKWDNIASIDSIFVAWNETNGTDGDDYYLFFTKESPTNITATWMNTYLSSAIPLGDPKPNATTGLIRTGFTIAPGVTPTTDGVVLQEGDQIYVLVAAADATGNLSLRGDLDNAPISNHVFGAFLVGPLCPPRDYITDCSVPAEADSADWDMDVIHIVGDSTATGVTHYIYGDAGAIPCDADSVVVYDGDDPNADNLLGAGPVGSNGSFTFIELAETDADVNVVYVFSKSGDTDYSTGTPIIFQRIYPTIYGDVTSAYTDGIFDPWNPYRIYNDNDYINIRFLGARDADGSLITVSEMSGGICTDVTGTHNTVARSSVLHAWADFTQIDATTGNISGFGTPADSIGFTSLGADHVDNDGDWANSQDLDASGTIEDGELFDDVGLDGIAATNDNGEGDGLPTYGEPYCDENGNGQYDVGETFVDQVHDGVIDHVFNPGEPNLDSNDPDEFGWYELAASTANTRGTVRQGYLLANPIAEAMLDPYTPIPISIEDHGIDGTIRTAYPAGRDLPFQDIVSDFNRTLYHVKEHKGGDPERRFAAVLDVREPTIGEIVELNNETGAATDAGANLIKPGSPTYNLGRYVDLTTSHHSDRDVLYARMRIKIGGAWQDLSLDPSTATGAANDANADGFPGTEAYDEDADSSAARVNGFDDDHDGLTDEVGEGIDFSDREVAAAAQDSVTDAANTNANGLHCQNDYTDNDNDAFFVYDSYFAHGLDTTPGSGIGRIFWYNVDESTTNNFDDDNDGTVDEADEAAESAGYGTGATDDNEDGIANGEAVEVPLGTPGAANRILPVTSYLAIAYDPFGLGLYAPPTPGPGVDAGFIRVDAAHVFGRRPVNGNDTKNTPFYANELSYGEVVGEAYEDLTNSTRTFAVGGYQLGGGADSTSAENRKFNWADTHGGDNIDWEVLSKIYGLTADGATTYQIRLNGYDRAGNVKELWSEPISFTLDLTPPAAEITDCSTGGAPEEFADVSPSRAGIQVYDAGKHPDDYTLTATADAEAKSVTFYSGPTADFADASPLGTDNTAPYTWEWPGSGMYTVNNYPAANSDTVYFFATAEDEFGNTTPDEDVCATMIEVIDGTNPTTIITQVGTDDDLEDGACVPPDSSITIFANVFDNDLDLNGNPLNWCAGLDGKTGDANIDDDDDGQTDEDDVDGDGIFTLGIDDDGADNIPGTNDDEWNGSETGGFSNLNNTDDYQTYDIVKVVFEYNPVGDNPDLGWLPIDTVHGDPYSNPPEVIDWTQPVAATWNTLDLPTGNYDVRAWACDIEGNCDSLTAFITSVCIRNEPLRAYILPEVCTEDTEYSLFALHHIHDYEIDQVRFEYYYDANGNGCADDGGSWTEINTDDESTGRGDAVLYWPSAELLGSEKAKDADPIQDLVYVAPLRGDGEDLTRYMFWDQDHDGYSPKDPVIEDPSELNHYNVGDKVVIGDPDQIPDGAPLTDFAEDEYFAEASGEDGTLDETDWIFRQNHLNGEGDNSLDLWNVSWDVTGLPVGSYLVRSIATDETNQEDVITYTCYNPAEQNPEEIEQVVIDTEIPSAEFSAISLPNGSTEDISGSNQPYIPGNTGCFKICATADDAARVKFEYSLDGGANWHDLDVNNDEDFFSDVDGVTGFTSGDEIFNDLNGNWQYDGPAVDFVRYDGGDGVVDTPIGWPLCALSGEDGDAPANVLAEPMEPNGTCPGYQLHDGDEVQGAEITGGDIDMYSFYASAGDGILIETASSGGNDMDTVLQLLGEDCATSLSVDDDGGTDNYSLIETTAPYTGLYNFRVTGYNGETGDYNVSLEITSEGNTDDDKDGVADEDPLVGDPVDGVPGSPEDYTSPYCVYVDMTKLPLWTDVNVLFRATAADQVCDIYREDPSPDVVSVILGENQPPETDIVRAEDKDGVEFDVRPAIMDSTGCGTIGSDLDTLRVFVTAEDLSSVDSVDLYYRLDPNCYPNLTFEERQWKSMSDEGWTAVDAVYPYDFNIATDNIPDGAYQFYPRAVDKNGNVTPAPNNPWCFKKFANAGVDFAYVSTPTPPPAAPDHAAPGDEYVIHGSLIDPAQAPTTAVRFYYAERQLDESIDPLLVQPLAPYTSAKLAEYVVSTEPGDGVVVTLNGSVLTYGVDYTVNNAGNAIVFTTRPAATDVITVSYNISGWSQIDLGDDWSPYTVAWSVDDGGVPEPNNADTDAYDLIAAARFDVNGDGEYNGSEECDYDEALLSEGNYLILDDQERPLVKIYGLDWSDDDPQQQLDCPDLNWPGNPLFNSGDNIGDYDYVAKLSGIETDVFVVAADQGGGSIDSVSLAITAEVLTGATAPVTKTFAMTEYTVDQTTIDIPVTFYEDDYPQWTPSSLENVLLQVSTDAGDSWKNYEMTDGGSYWQATGRFAVGQANLYRFQVDLVGDLQETVVDARNHCQQVIGKGGEQSVSVVIVPETPFWYTHLDDATDLSNNSVHQAVATAFDNSGNSGSNLNSGMPGDPSTHQGQVVFVYDNTKPEVDGILALDLDGRPLKCDRVSPQDTYNLIAEVNDDPFTDLNILAVNRVEFQYSPNNGQAWLNIATAFPADDGGFAITWEPINGEHDGYDNDGDGLWDEEDERIYTAQIRAIAFDDGNNSSYSDRQTPPVVWSILVDAAEPTAELSSPLNGQVFTYDESITMAGQAHGDWIPTAGTSDIDHVRFQVRLGAQEGSIFYVDNAPGHDGYYDNGIDELWADANHNDLFDDGDQPLWPGVDGSFESAPDGEGDEVAAQFWLDLDPTPQDNGDLPQLNAPNNGTEYRLAWTPNDYAFTRGYIGDDLVWQVDEYVRGRMLTTDCAGNDDTDGDGHLPPYVLFLLNDDTTPRAYITEVDDKVIDPVETVAVQGRDAVDIEGTVGPKAWQVVRVNLFMEHNGVETYIGSDIDDSVYDGGTFSLAWDASALEEGDYTLFATTVDEDGNESDHAAAARVHVRIDRTAPVVAYDVQGSLFNGFTVTESYTDDGQVDHSSDVIHPDLDTHDVLFQVATSSTDVTSIVLQWRFAADPIGLWRSANDLFDDASDAFDYEPNLNYTAGGVTYQVWRLHVEDFANQLLNEGPMVFRGLATDEAGNTNALQTDYAAATADATDPTLFDWNDDSPTNQVEVGSSTHFEIALQDLDYTDVMQAQLWYRNVTDGGEWKLYGADTELEGQNVDTDNATWIAEFDWVAPTFVVHDTSYEFKVIAWDSAWNDAELNHPNDFTLTVEDNASPDRTKIVWVAGEVLKQFDFCDTPRGEGGGGGGGFDPDNQEVYVDVDQNGIFTYGTDIAISEGALQGMNDDCDLNEVVGGVCDTYPRRVDEGYLSDANARNEARVAREVTIVARTQADDDGIDAGIAFVTFIAQRLDDNGNVVATYELGKDEYAPFFPLYYWHLVWNTLDTDVSGNRLYPDGRYRLGAWAVDQEGNVEDQSTLDMTAAIIVVDNTEPATQMDADAHTPAVEKTVTAQRNSMFTLFARTLAPGSNTEVNDEDDTVTFWYKRSRDLNMEDSWTQVPGDAGYSDEDGNPDETRPYSFDVNLGQLTDPTDEINNPPLAVGESYDFVASAGDPNCNEIDEIDTFADDAVPGVGTRHITLNIIDTIAPCLEITELERKHGDTDVIHNPTKVHAQDLEYIQAKLLTGDRDLDHVEFVYRKLGDTTWNLIDADLTGSHGGVVWTLGEWDLRTLDHNTWYEVAAVGVDNVGNVCSNPDIVQIYVDYEAPPMALIAPANGVWCDRNVLHFGREISEIVQVERGDANQHDDVWDVIWEVKGSDADSTQWVEFNPGPDTYDDVNNTYGNVLDLTDLESTEGLTDCNSASTLWDMRVRILDVAGNENTIWTWKNVVDLTEPNHVQISNIKWDGQDVTQDPYDGSQWTDVTAGTRVEIFGTASDDEPCIPAEFETGIAIMKFQAAYDIGQDGDANDGETWRDLGTLELNPPDHGDPSAVSDSVAWNTTGLAEGQYFVRVGVRDQCNNPQPQNFTWSSPANVRVTDQEPPIAWVSCWDSDLQPHGDNPPTMTTLYAMAESDPNIVDVQFQYNVREAGETVPTGEWVNIGLPALQYDNEDPTTQKLWATTIVLNNFADGQQLWLRALARDDAGNRYGDSPEDIVPVLAAHVMKLADGTWTLAANGSADQQGGSQVINDVSLQVAKPTTPGDNEPSVIVTIKMANVEDVPRVTVMSETALLFEYPSDDNAFIINQYFGDLRRSVSDPTVWNFEMDEISRDDDCYNWKVCVSALDGTTGTVKWVDMKSAEFHEHPIDIELGTNGTVALDAYGQTPGIQITAVPGSSNENDCLLVSSTYAPITSHDENMYLKPVDGTAYHLEMMGTFGETATGAFNHGYEPLVVIHYSDAAVAAALEGTQATEDKLEVRRWNPNFDNGDGTLGRWVATGITHVNADPTTNSVSFRVDNLHTAWPFTDDKGVANRSGFSAVSDGNIFQVFVETGNGPVTFASFWPTSPYVNDVWTDATPEVVAYLKDQGGQPIDPQSVEVLIDGEFWATWYLTADEEEDLDCTDGADADTLDDDCGYEADFRRGSTVAFLQWVNSEHTVMELRYDHSGDRRDWLTDGEHTMTVRYQPADGSDQWIEGTTTFNVDRTSPYIAFDGGWVTNPRLINLAGYMNPADQRLQVKMYDGGSGILFKHNRGSDGYYDDYGVKYDLWWVNGEDDQNDIDEIEQRTLLHQGTADELAPWVTPKLEDYNPATDTLRVPVPVVGGGVIKNGDVLEVVWYSDKYIEANNDGPGFGCSVDTMTVNGHSILVYGLDCTYDSYSQEMHIYNQGVLDWAGNSGSRYVEQRFIVDMLPPTCTVVSPAATVEPDGEINLEIAFSDGANGAGVDPASIKVEVYDPSGNEVEITDLVITENGVTGKIPAPLVKGEYQVRIEVKDLLGNKCVTTRTVRVEAAILTMTDAMAYPNPFNPAEANANIHFTLSRTSNVTVKIYDWNGQYVTTLAANQSMDGSAHSIQWGGEASDGTDLANGTYIARVTATDGKRTEEANLKVVLWRE